MMSQFSSSFRNISLDVTTQTYIRKNYMERQVVQMQISGGKKSLDEIDMTLVENIDMPMSETPTF